MRSPQHVSLKQKSEIPAESENPGAAIFIPEKHISNGGCETGSSQLSCEVTVAVDSGDVLSQPPGPDFSDGPGACIYIRARCKLAVGVSAAPRRQV